MKRMATKLLRLTADEKREAQRITHTLTGELNTKPSRYCTQYCVCA